jgi:hypothetical protein
MTNREWTYSIGPVGMAVLFLVAANGAVAEQVFRPKCNIRVEAYDAPKQSVVPVGTRFYKCPDERVGAHGWLAVDANYKIVGEYGDWYEYQGRSGFGYFRKTGITVGSTSRASAGPTNESAANVAPEGHPSCRRRGSETRQHAGGSREGSKKHQRGVRCCADFERWNTPCSRHPRCDKNKRRHVCCVF